MLMGCTKFNDIQMGSHTNLQNTLAHLGKWCEEIQQVVPTAKFFISGIIPRPEAYMPALTEQEAEQRFALGQQVNYLNWMIEKECNETWNFINQEGFTERVVRGGVERYIEHKYRGQIHLSEDGYLQLARNICRAIETDRQPKNE